MTLDDIDDFLDEEVEEITLRDEDSISQLCFSIFDSVDNTPIGTGFIVDKTGLFLSARHNFKTSELALIEKQQRGQCSHRRSNTASVATPIKRVNITLWEPSVPFNKYQGISLIRAKPNNDRK